MNLKVIIVEDNPLTVRSLVETIDWSALGCYIAGTAYDGESGRKLILSEKPDILLIDIRMPQSNGLEMLEAVRDEVSECKVVVITGYEEFQYAVKAVKLSVFDYLLKPVDNEEVIQAVERAVSAIHQDKELDFALVQAQTARRRAKLLSLLVNPAQRKQDVSTILDGIDIHFEAYYVITIQKPNDRIFTQEDLNHINNILSSTYRVTVFLLYDTIIALVMLDDALEQWKEDCEIMIDKICESSTDTLRMGVSELSYSLHTLNQAYHQSREALWSAALGQQMNNAVYYHKDGDHMCFEAGSDVNRQIEMLITQSDLSDDFAYKAAETIYALSGQQFSRLRAMVALYAMALCNRHNIPFTTKIDTVMSDLWDVTDLEDTRCGLVNLSQALRVQQSSYSLLTRSALQYISLHATKGLQLSDLAEELHVSTSYLSSIIRKETGITFNEHLTEGKMTVARAMLSDPRVLVEEIAYAVGYKNYISFYNAFKRTQHMTPTEYRNKLALS